MSTPRIRLITRGDDSGSCVSANRAILEAYKMGILRNTSVMVPGIAFLEAAQMFANEPGICLGLHVTLNAEWDSPKWGPVLPVDQVPSLVDAQGYFLPTPQALQERGGAQVSEMLAEVQAQLDRARAHGLNISYLDEHMAVSWPWPAFREGLAAMAAREGLIDTSGIPGLPSGDGGGSDPITHFINRLATVPPGTYVFVAHPGYDEPDMREFKMGDMPYGQIARERDFERRVFTDPRVIEACRTYGVEPIKYSEVAATP